MSDQLRRLSTPKGLLREITGQRQMERQRAKQAEALQKQQNRENAALAEATSDLARTRARLSNPNAGRRSLINTSATGITNNLGGS